MADPNTTDAGQVDGLPHPEAVAIHARLDAGDARMTRIEKSLAANTAATARVEANTAELLDWFASGKGAFKVLEGLGKLAKPLAAIVGLCVAVATAWTIYRGGTPK